MNDKHFDKIFWLLAGALALAFAYVFLITFAFIPKDNIRFADTALGFILGTVIGGVITFFVGGSPTLLRKNDTPAATGTISGELTVAPGQAEA